MKPLRLLFPLIFIASAAGAGGKPTPMPQVKAAGHVRNIGVRNEGKPARSLPARADERGNRPHEVKLPGNHNNPVESFQREETWGLFSLNPGGVEAHPKTISIIFKAGDLAHKNILQTHIYDPGVFYPLIS